MKNDDKIRNLLKTGAIVLGSTLILSIPATLTHNLDETKRMNANYVLASQLDSSAIDVEETLNEYLQDNEVIKINTCKNEKLYTRSSAIVATGNQIEKYLLAHEIDTVLIDGTYFTKDGRDLEVVERKAADIVVKDGIHTYQEVDGYALEGKTYKKIKDIETISYSELENYALVKSVKVYYSDYLDSSPEHSSSYSLIKL